VIFGTAEPEPGVLDRVVGLARRAEHAVGHRGQAAPVLLEALRRPVGGRVPDMAGPRVYELRELVHGYLRARHKHRPIVPVRPPGKAARAFRTGANLAPDRAVGRRTWEEFLAERVA
jgi:hypothetical protein